MLRIPIALLVVALLPILMPTPASATERPVASIRARGEFVTIASVEATGCLEVFLQALRQENRLNLGESIFLFYEVWDHCTPAPDGSSATRIARGFGSVPVDSTALALDVRKEPRAAHAGDSDGALRVGRPDRANRADVDAPQLATHGGPAHHVHRRGVLHHVSEPRILDV